LILSYTYKKNKNRLFEIKNVLHVVVKKKICIQKFKKAKAKAKAKAEANAEAKA
jgi:hypothetical protein